MKQITGYAKTYDWTGVDINKAYGYGYISLTLGDDVGTKLPVEDVTKLAINLFEPDDIITDNLQKPLTPYNTGEVLTGVMGTNVTNSTVPAICEGDLTFFGQPVVVPYDDNFMLSDWGYPFAFKQPWGSGSANIPYYSGNLNGPTKSSVNYQRKKYFWDTGNTISDDVVAFNGEMLSPLPFTKDSPVMLQYGDFIYFGPKGGAPEMSDDDVSEGDYTFSFGGRTLETTRWRHKSSSRIYFGDGLGNGPSIGFGWNLTSGPSWGITIYSDSDVPLGSLTQLPQVNTVYDDYLYITRVGSDNTQNIGALSSWALGVKYDDNGEIDDIYILVDQTDNVVNLANRHFVFWGSLKDEADTLLGSSTITYAGFKYLLDNVYKVSDPYQGAGTSKPGGGGGSWDYSTDIITPPGLPPSLGISKGFVSVYAPTNEQIDKFAEYLFSDWWETASVYKLFSNFTSAIISFSVFPFSVPRGENETVAIGGSIIREDVVMARAGAQYIEINCGTIHIDAITGSYLDYETQYDLYLPYIGSVPLRAEDVVDKDVEVVYHIDILTGALTCYVVVGGTVLYNYNGQCGQQIPLSSTDYSAIYSAAVNAGLALLGPVGAGVSAAGAMTALTDVTSSMVSGRLKPNIQKSGSMSGPGGMLNIQKPYITITAPNVCIPEGQSIYQGYPLIVTQQLGSLSGYTVVRDVHPDGFYCTDQEIEEIERLLKSGVVL